MERWKHTKSDDYTCSNATPPEGTERPLNLIESLMLENVERLRTHMAKYEPLVGNLQDDMEFAALYQVVMAERQRRVMRLFITNPGFRNAAIYEAEQRQKEMEKATRN